MENSKLNRPRCDDQRRERQRRRPYSASSGFHTRPSLQSALGCFQSSCWGYPTMFIADEPPTLTRTELYERLWSEPLSRIAKSLKVTDSVLRRHCRDLLIPVPNREYWKKKRNGQSVRKTKLPLWEDGNEPRIFLNPTDNACRGFGVMDADIAARVSFEKDPANKITVPERLTSPHPMVRTTKQAMKSAFHGMYDRLMPPWSPEEVLRIEVCDQSVERALLLMDTLLKALRSRGYDTAFQRCDYNRDQLYEATLLGCGFHFVIRERFQRIEKPDSDEWSRIMVEYEYRPTGNLRFLVFRDDGWGPMFTFTDGKVRLEDRLNGLVIKLLRKVQDSRRREILSRLRDMERAEADQERRKAEEAARVEKQMEEQIIEAASAWSRCVHIREYVEAVRAEARRRSGDSELADETAKWLQWADAYVERLSPLGADKPLPRIVEPEIDDDPSDFADPVSSGGGPGKPR